MAQQNVPYVAQVDTTPIDLGVEESKFGQFAGWLGEAGVGTAQASAAEDTAVREQSLAQLGLMDKFMERYPSSKYSPMMQNRYLQLSEMAYPKAGSMAAMGAYQPSEEADLFAARRSAYATQAGKSAAEAKYRKADDPKMTDDYREFMERGFAGYDVKQLVKDYKFSPQEAVSWAFNDWMSKKEGREAQEKLRKDQPTSYKEFRAMKDAGDTNFASYGDYLSRLHPDKATKSAAYRLWSELSAEAEGTDQAVPDFNTWYLDNYSTTKVGKQGDRIYKYTITPTGEVTNPQDITRSFNFPEEFVLKSVETDETGNFVAVGTKGERVLSKAVMTEEGVQLKGEKPSSAELGTPSYYVNPETDEKMVVYSKTNTTRDGKTREQIMADGYLPASADIYGTLKDDEKKAEAKRPADVGEDTWAEFNEWRGNTSGRLAKIKDLDPETVTMVFEDGIYDDDAIRNMRKKMISDGIVKYSTSPSLYKMVTHLSLPYYLEDVAELQGMDISDEDKLTFLRTYYPWFNKEHMNAVRSPAPNLLEVLFGEEDTEKKPEGKAKPGGLDAEAKSDELNK